MPQLRFVGYCRSSTPEQTIGIEIQRQQILSYVARVGGEILGWYVEMRPASPVARKIASYQPALCHALDHCRSGGATLVVARLDRLSRSAAFLTSLLERGPPICVAEIPNASRFVLQIYAAVAEEYRHRVSRRIKAVKARARQEGRAVNPHSKKVGKRLRVEAMRRNRPLCTAIEEIRWKRSMTAGDVAEQLNSERIFTPTGKDWTEASVQQFWRRYHRGWHSTRFPRRQPVGPHRLQEQALTRAAAFRSTIEEYRRDGLKTGPEICARLNADGITTVTGRQWSRELTYRLLQRLQLIKGAR